MTDELQKKIVWQNINSSKEKGKILTGKIIAIENDQNDIIKSTLKELKSQEYQVFIMFYSEGKTVKEIAKILNFSESKVKVVLHRVMKKIKTNLEDGGYSYGK